MQKTCNSCKHSLDLTNFTKLKSSPDGLNRTCRDCHRVMTKAYWASKPEQRKAKATRWKLKKRYGITPALYNQMLVAQDGKCAIAGCFSATRLHVDHCHKTGKVRALLCQMCNMALGCIKENRKIALELIKYISVHKDGAL